MMAGRILLSATAGFLVFACEPPPTMDEPDVMPSSGVEATAPLTDIMRNLAADLAAAAYGIWIEEVDTIVGASRRVADHPKVKPEERMAIQTTLGSEFGDFVTFDQNVHRAATELVDAAMAGAAFSDLLAKYVRIEEGCVGCHDRFRARVTAARISLESGPLEKE